MQNNYKKDYIWNTLGVFAQSALSPLLLIVVTRINGISDSGLFSFAFSVAVIFWAIGLWGGRTYQVSDVQKEFPVQSYLIVRLILTTVMLVGAVLFCVANGYDMTKSGIIISLVLFKAIESIADAIQGVLQTNQHLFIAGKALVYKAVIGFMLFLVTDFLTGSILLSCIGVIVVNALITVVYDLRIAENFESLKIVRRLMKRYTNDALIIIRRCAPVSAVIFLSLFSLNIPRYFIDEYSRQQVGYYGIIAMPITLIVLLMFFILQPKVVTLARLYDRREYTAFDATVAKLIAITATIGSFIWLLAFFLGVPALNLVFGLDFSSYKSALLIMIIGGITNALVSVIINILIITRHFRDQFYILFVTNLALIVLSATLVRANGLLKGVILFAAINAVQLVALVVTYTVSMRNRVKGANGRAVS